MLHIVTNLFGIGQDSEQGLQLRSQYRDNLEALDRGSRRDSFEGWDVDQHVPLTREVLAGLCPHLPEHQLDELLQRKPGSVVTIAAPPLLVGDCFHRISIIWSEKPWLSLDRAQFLKSSGAKYAPRPVPFQDEAVAYARQHWSNSLIKRSWVDVVEIHLQDPGKLVIRNNHMGNQYNRPKTMLRLGIALCREQSAISNDNSAPRCDLYDRAIVHISNTQAENLELRPERFISAWLNCYRCGQILDLNSCRTCKLRFDDDKEACCCGTQLTPKMLEYVRSLGHELVQGDPAANLAREREAWAELKRHWANKK